jgi:hypothetical protein
LDVQVNFAIVYPKGISIESGRSGVGKSAFEDGKLIYYDLAIQQNQNIKIRSFSHMNIFAYNNERLTLIV